MAPDATQDGDAPLTVVMLEDSPLDVELAVALFQRERIAATIHTTDDGAEFARLVAEARPDLILSDYYLPTYDGPSALATARTLAPHVPFIFVSGTMGEELAIEALKLGATDYVLKTPLERLGPAVRRALAESRLRRERRLVAEAWQESENRFRRLADSAPVLIWVTGPGGELEYTNRPFAAFTGVTSAELDGAGWAPLIHPDERATVLAEFQTVHADGREFRRVVRLRRADGDHRWFQAVGTPREERAGAFAGLVGTFSDVTELKRAEQATLEADRLKDEFLAVLAHELRNPLAPIRNSLQILKLSPEGNNPGIRSAREMMERQVKQLVRLVDDLLDVSRITRNKLILQRETLVLADVVAEAVEAVRPALAAAGHDLQITPEPLPTVMLSADYARLAQILTNLLTNAVKFTPPGGRVALAVARRGREAVVRVTDSGIGIAAADLGRIFEPFAQADRVPGAVSEGLGVGLSLVKRLAKLHGGSVEVASAGPNLGSTFTVRLPALHGSTPTLRLPSARPVAAAAGRRVLVLDDSRDNAQSLGDLLRMMGMEVRVARDGRSALAAAADFAPEVALLDLGLPGMDGFEVARRMVRWTNPPLLVAVSGYAQPEDRQKSAAAGFAHHLAKPVDPDELRRIIEESSSLQVVKSSSPQP